MLNALAYALVDAVNVLLIGVLVALAMMTARGRYRSITILLLIGNWLGVIGLALIVLLAFDGLGTIVEQVVDSPAFGALLILTGVVTALWTLRQGDDGPPPIVDRILTPVRTASPLTVLAGVGLGAVQSATSVPFYAGLAVLSSSGLPAGERYTALLAYATVALSIPVLAAMALGLVRVRPRSWAGRLFVTARRHHTLVARGAAYLVSALLIVIGILRLL
ncbi:hypothetical protein [Gordonia sp. NPDC003950]|jgi:hypothetical protein